MKWNELLKCSKLLPKLKTQAINFATLLGETERY